MSYLLDEAGDSPNNAKIIFFGLAEAGKTSICDVLFKGKLPEEVNEYDATIEYNRIHQPIYKKKKAEKIQIIDTGGQNTFFPIFFSKLEEFLFSNIKTFVWVLDISKYNIKEFKYEYLLNTMKLTSKYSPNARMLLFLHKIDLVDIKSIEQSVNEVESTVQEKIGLPISFYKTSIFNDSLNNIFDTDFQ